MVLTLRRYSTHVFSLSPMAMWTLLMGFGLQGDDLIERPPILIAPPPFFNSGHVPRNEGHVPVVAFSGHGTFCQHTPHILD